MLDEAFIRHHVQWHNKKMFSMLILVLAFIMMTSLAEEALVHWEEDSCGKMHPCEINIVSVKFDGDASHISRVKF